MANRTVKDAHTIHGTNPQYLIEKIIRSRIYECKYWKEECFALTSELLVDKAMELKYVGGVVGGNIRPTPFLCLILKMLQIQPEKDIVVEFIKNEDFKYVRALGAYYMRLTGTGLDCYKYLEPLYNDYRKIRRVSRDGTFFLTHVDEFVEELLSEERSCDVILPRIQKRSVLEENNQLETRVSALEEDLDALVESGSEEEDYYMEGSRPIGGDEADGADNAANDGEKKRDRDRDRGRSRSRSRSPGGHHKRDKKRRTSRERERGGDRGERDRPRHRSRSRERVERSDRGADRDRGGGERGGGERGGGRKREEERRGGGRHGERERDRGEKEKESRKEKRSGREKRGGDDDDIDDDIREANELRAKLGLPPLKP